MVLIVLMVLSSVNGVDNVNGIMVGPFRVNGVDSDNGVNGNIQC